MMKEYIAFGGGVNSTAMKILLGNGPEMVFANHGGDRQETYDHINYLRDVRGWRITEVSSPLGTLYDHCMREHLIPSRLNRWCTDKFKIRPMMEYVEKPCVIYVGIDAGEKQRIWQKKKKGVEYRYPLIEAGLDRAGCVKLITRYGYSVPPKSGCWFCPFMKVAEARALPEDLYLKAKALEDNCMREDLYLLHKPLESFR